MSSSKLDEKLKAYRSKEKEWELAKKRKPKEASLLVEFIENKINKDDFEVFNFPQSQLDLDGLVQFGYLTENGQDYDISQENLVPILFVIFTKRITAALKNAQEISNIFRVVSRVFHSLHLDRTYQYVFTLYLHKYTDIELLGDVVIKLLEEEELNSIFHNLCKVIPFYELKDIKSFLEVIEKMLASTSPQNIARGSIIRSFEGFAEYQKKDALRIYEFVIDNERIDLFPLLSSIIFGLSKKDFELSFKKARNLVDKESLGLQLQGIISLGLIDYSVNGRDEFLDEAIKILQVQYDEKNPQKYPALAQTYGNLVWKSEDGLNKIVELSEFHNPEVQYNISRFLLHNDEEILSNEDLEKVLFNLSEVRCEHLGILRNLDSVLYKLAEKDPRLVCDFYREWKLGRRDDELNNDCTLPNIFSSSCPYLLKNKVEVTNRLITSWLLSEHHLLHHEVQNLIGELTINNENQDLELDTSLINNSTLAENIYLIKKIYGYVFQGRQLCSLLFSVLNKRQIKKETEGFLRSLFKQEIIFNYLGISKDFFDEKKVKADGHFKRKFANEISNYIDKEISLRKSLNFLEEFRVPVSKTRIAKREKNKHYKRLQDQARQKSPLLSIVKNTPIKYGKKFFTMVDGKFTAPTPLTRHSASFEIPKGEMIDPIGQKLMRINFRALDKDEVSN